MLCNKMCNIMNMKMNIKLVMIYLRLKNYVVTFFRYLLSFIFSVKEIHISYHDQITSVYFRYIILKLMLSLGLFMKSRFYCQLMDWIDVDADSIKMVITYNYVDRHIICNVSSPKMAIRYIMYKVRSENAYLNSQIQIPNNYIIVNCSLITNEDDKKKIINMKSIINKYLMDGKFDNTFKNIFQYEGIHIHTTTILKLQVFKQIMAHNIDITIGDLLDRHVEYIYQISL